MKSVLISIQPKWCELIAKINNSSKCDYIADEIRLLIEHYENTRLNLREAQLEINRQKAEIERLNRALVTQEKQHELKMRLSKRK